MPKHRVFYSFHYDNDVFRVQLIRNVGALEENPPVSTNEWEHVKRGGAPAIQRWIDQNMAGKSCVVVLVGSETANRPWVQYEIRKAWSEGKGLLGVRIHNINCARTRMSCQPGPNPFDQFSLNDGRRLSSVALCHQPNRLNAYGDIRANLQTWVEQAVARRAGG